MASTFISLKKTSPSESLHRYKLYKKGEEKYIKEFDAVKIARSLRNLKMLVASLMDDSERFLSTYQQFNAISLISESNKSDSSSSPYDKIPRLLSSKTKRNKHEEWINKFMVSAL